VSSLSKQVSFENGSFYVLQTPQSGEPLYYIGELILEENSAKGRAGFFTTYDLSFEQSLGSPKAFLKSDELKSYLKDEASSAELRLNPNFEGKTAYRQTFRDIQHKMKIGELKKAVLFSSSVWENENFPTKAIFFSYSLKLLERQKSGFVFGYYNPKSRRAYLGLTPEYLCREHLGVKYTTAVAGTKMESDSSKDWSSKLIKEHELVMKGIDKIYKTDWSKTHDQAYGNLRHLRSEGRLKTEDSIETVSGVLHPTSAVGALPQEKSYSYKMGDLSSKERRHFGGYAGLYNIESPFSLVTIRGLEWSNNKAFVCIGGGVLPESHFEDEWAELEKKWETFKGLWWD